jgi:hypothetical protein
MKPDLEPGLKFNSGIALIAVSPKSGCDTGSPEHGIQLETNLLL